MSVLFGWACAAATAWSLARSGRRPRGTALRRSGALALAAWVAMAVLHHVLGVAIAQRLLDGVLAVAMGSALGAWFLRAALPDRRAWLRGPAAAVVLSATAWVVYARSRGEAFELGGAWIAVGGVAALAALFALAGIDRGIRFWNQKWRGSVRFACPRCGVDGDWARPVSECSQCGLFVRVDWDPGAAEPNATPLLGANAAFRCPLCRARHRWPLGERACPTCGVAVSLSWNEHALDR